MKIIAITALKGGTGKSVITFNIAGLLAQKFRKKNFNSRYRSSTQYE